MSWPFHDTGHSCDLRSMVGISVQGPALRAIPVTSCLHQSHGGGPCSPERMLCACPQLPRWLAHACAFSRGRRSHWNFFRGSWDHFSTGSMAKSRGGCGNPLLTRLRLHQPATQPSACGWIPSSFGQECPWNMYPGILWYSRMTHVQRASSVRDMDGSPTA